MKRELPENLPYYQICQIFMDPISLRLKIEFINPLNPSRIFLIEFIKIALIRMSKVSEEEEGCFLIGDITLEFVRDLDQTLKGLGAKTIMPDSQYGDEIYLLSIEGGLCLDVLGVIKEMKFIE